MGIAPVNAAPFAGLGRPPAKLAENALTETQITETLRPRLRPALMRVLEIFHGSSDPVAGYHFGVSSGVVVGAPTRSDQIAV
jgi:hypothetical protein